MVPVVYLNNKNFMKYFVMVIITVGLVNYWLVPVYFENKFVLRVSRIFKERFDNLDILGTESLIIKKVEEMNKLVEIHRLNFLVQYNLSEPVDSLSLSKRVHLFEEDPRYYELIKNFSCVTVITIKIDHVDDGSIYNKMFDLLANNSLHSANISAADNPWLFHKKYYRFTASQLLCLWITNDDINFRYGYFYNFTCNTDIRKATIPTHVNPLFFNARNPTGHDEGSAQPLYRFQLPTIYHAMQIFTKVVVTSVGECFCDELQVKFYDCLNSPSQPPSIDQIANLTFHKEVFVISQRWGHGYFHRMIENIPRVALFLRFLTSHPGIKILAYDRAERLLESLEILGINRDRVISGWVRSDIAYVPRSTSCGTPNFVEMQFLHRQNTKYIIENIVDRRKDERNKLILINRSRSRRFANSLIIEQLLNKIAVQYGFEFVIFRDNPAPSLNETLLSFHLASIVVAPHGAGLSNLVYSRPGTLVIEGLCNRPVVNLCYQKVAYALGMRWYGIPALQGCESVVDVNGEEIDLILRSYLGIIPYEELTSLS